MSYLSTLYLLPYYPPNLLRPTKMQATFEGAPSNKSHSSDRLALLLLFSILFKYKLSQYSLCIKLTGHQEPLTGVLGEWVALLLSSNPIGFYATGQQSFIFTSLFEGIAHWGAVKALFLLLQRLVSHVTVVF